MFTIRKTQCCFSAVQGLLFTVVTSILECISVVLDKEPRDFDLAHNINMTNYTVLIT